MREDLWLRNQPPSMNAGMGNMARMVEVSAKGTTEYQLCIPDGPHEFLLTEGRGQVENLPVWGMQEKKDE
jgi:hypothetical protein